jgi:hypothetical protein
MTATRFELVLDHDKMTFQLRTHEGQTLLTGLGSTTSKIMLQNDILHVRRASTDASHLVEHEGKDGTHWVTVKDKDGSVLAKSPHVATVAAMQEIKARILAVVAAAPIVDLAKRAVHAH